MSFWTLRVVWPITDPDAFTEASLGVARAELPGIAEGLQVTLLGPPRFRTARGHVVCEAPAIRRTTPTVRNAA